ncbi:Gfo/Idh/MocA family protein [Paludibaculum fermentans]|uniref:Gfo/Idh/MocA family oxidoreductase n=1 Tax=Paludibaculum fermentans TaxID=1473598 RepID=A0A7S7NTY0_PALFE|nr:Gfo/Idh/MocA family oxidoreductase [Paludibaculum fermentans]QOY89204.1 Gfo/Idh/MocA family oxidoreductase [Paludibaculum fermentans]
MSTRRTFVAGAGGVVVSHLAAKQAMAANDKLRIAVIGTNGRGKDHIQGIMQQPDAEVVTLCDVDLKVGNARAEAFEKKYGKKPQVVQDMRRVFDDKNIDAVTIATPNHWHSLAAIWACQAGKDVYVEKPGSHNIYEGRKLVEAAHKYKRIVQHGVQLRSSTAVREAVEHLQKGVIGNVYMSRGLVFRWRPSIGKQGVVPVPEGLDYDMWTGPAEKEPFSRRIVHYNWHWTWNYGNGDVGNQGIHETDLCMWGLGVKGFPSKITAMGGKFLFDDDKITPEVLTTLYHYPGEKKLIQFEVRPWCTNSEDGASVGNIFYGSEGYMVIKGYDTYETYLGQKKEKGPSGKAGGDHYANWIKAIRSRKTEDQHGPVETAHLASGLAHLGNISYRLGRVLNFDPAKEKFVNDKEADTHLTRNYRKGFEVPAKV